MKKTIRRRGLTVLLIIGIIAFAGVWLAKYAFDTTKEGVQGPELNVREHRAPFNEITFPTPNVGEGINAVRGVVLHHTAEDSVEKALKILTDPNRGVSCHVLIDTDGTRFVLAPPEAITWHAGYSSLDGEEEANNFTIGIEFQGNTLVRPLTEEQIESGIEYLLPIMSKYDVSPERIVTHERVRKEWKERHPKSRVPDKPDIVPTEYARFMHALTDSLASLESKR